jgi:hypothetical protein
MNNTEKLIKKNEQQFSYLEHQPFFIFHDSMDGFGEYIHYNFKEESETHVVEAIIKVPLNEQFPLCFTFHHFLKTGLNHQYWVLEDSNKPIEKTPTWFQEMYDDIKEKIEKRDRIRSIVNQKN